MWSRGGGYEGVLFMRRMSGELGEVDRDSDIGSGCGSGSARGVECGMC